MNSEAKRQKLGAGNAQQCQKHATSRQMNCNAAKEYQECCSDATYLPLNPEGVPN